MLFGDEEAVNIGPYWRGEGSICAATALRHVATMTVTTCYVFFETNVLCAADSQVHD